MTSLNFSIYKSVLSSVNSCVVWLHQAEPQKVKSHPSGVGVRPHLPTSELVCADELWTDSVGMFFCGDYKGHTVTGKPPLNCHTATALFQKDFQEVALCKANTLPTTPFTPPTVNLPIPPDPLASQQGQTKRPGSKLWVLLMDLEYVFLTLLHSVYIFLEYYFWESTFSFPLGSYKAKRVRGSHVVVFLGKVLIFFEVFRKLSTKSKWQRLHIHAGLMLSSHNLVFPLLCLRKCVVDSQAVTYCKLSVKLQNHVNHEDWCIIS